MILTVILVTFGNNPYLNRVMQIEDMIHPAIGKGTLRYVFAPPRWDREEWIDSNEHSDEDFDQSFADIRKVNRFLGGIAVVRRELDRFLVPNQRATLLDLGTGSADIPLALIRRARGKGASIQAVGLDTNEKVVRIAQLEAKDEPNLRLMVGDAKKLPFKDGSFDFVVSSLTFHHLSDSDAIIALCEMTRVARCAVIVNDLRRGYLPAALIWIVTRLTLMHPLTCHDGPLSVMRSRTVKEFRELAEWAGFTRAKVNPHPFWRLALVITKESI